MNWRESSMPPGGVARFLLSHINKYETLDNFIWLHNRSFFFDWPFNLIIYKLNIKLCASVSMKPFRVILYVIKLNFIKNCSSYLFTKEAYFLFISSVLARTKHLMTIARNEFSLILLPRLLKPSCVLSLLYVFAIIFSSLPWLKTTQLVRLEFEIRGKL